MLSSALLSTMVAVVSLAGLPLGTPGEADPLMSRIAPADCLFYMSWNGSGQPAADTINRLERMVAEPEVQLFLKQLDQQISGQLALQAARRRDPRAIVMSEAVPAILTSVLNHPGAFFLESVTIRPGGPHDALSGLMVNLGDDAAAVKTNLLKVVTVLQGEPETVTIQQTTFHRIRFGPGAPELLWSVRGKYLVAGLGEASVKGIFARVRNEPPEWLTEAHEEVAIPRPASFSYTNLGKAIDTFAPFGPPQTKTILQATGLDQLSTMATATGLDDTGFVTRTWTKLPAQPTGILSLANVDPLTQEDLQTLPADAMVALLFRLDAERVLDTALEILEDIEPRAAEQFRQEIARLDERADTSVRRILKSIGTRWSVHTSPGSGGVVTGWTLSVSVRDREALKSIQDQFVDLARQAAAFGRRGPAVKDLTFGDETIYYVVIPEEEAVVTPSWCLTDDELVVALYPQAIKARLSGDPDAATLADHPDVQRLLAGSPNPLGLSFVDDREIFRLLYPAIQIIAQVASGQARKAGLDLDISILPSPGAIEKHLAPTVAVKSRTKTGVDIVSHQTVPSMGIGASAPLAVALLLPAVQAAREAARRTASSNNLKQIMIGLHNHHDVYRAFPAGYSTDKDGKPLLSWRVHILPYLDHSNLYEQFRLDEPWDSDHNRKLIARMPSVYNAPGSNVEPGRTNYLGLFGEDKAFGPPSENGRPAGRRIASFTDGTSNTIAVVESSNQRAVIWTKPEADFMPDEKDPINGLVGVRPGGFLAGFCDGSVRFIAETVDKETLQRLFSRNDGQVVGDF